jgi:hypothetical protein
MKKITWSKHKNIIIFLLISIVGLIVYNYDKNGNIWKLIGVVGVATTLALSVLAFMTYIDYAKGEDIIEIYFKFPKDSNDNRKINTLVYAKRKHFTRGEVMGLLRMIQKGQGQFKIKDFNENTEILKRFNDIQNGISDELIIIANKQEQDQFWLLGEKEKYQSLHGRIVNKGQMA